MEQQGARGFGHLGRALANSLTGLRSALRHEEAFRQEAALFLVLAPLGLWLGDSGVERALLLGSLILVLITELANSGIEAVVDRVGEEYHPLSGRAKDFGSAAVFLSLANAVVVWLLVAVWPRLA
jgi:diacylglycerol kinase (ATP)